MAKINPFKASTLEMIANAIADIDPGITGSVIHRMLLQSQIEDISYNEQFLAKRKNYSAHLQIIKIRINAQTISYYLYKMFYLPKGMLIIRICSTK